MRFSIVTDTFPPEINGVAMTLRRLAEGLASAGHAVEVVRPKPAGHDGRVGKGGDPGRFLERQVSGIPLPGYTGLRLGLPQKRRLVKRWTDNRPDAIYVATEGLLGHSAVAAADSLAINTVSGYHTHFAQYMEHYRLHLFERLALRYLRRLHNRTTLTLAPTAQLVHELGRLGFENTELLGRGVDARLFHPEKRSSALRAEWGVGDDEPVGLYVGRIAPEKNLPLALATMRQLRAAHPKLKTVLVGDGPARASLQNRFPEAVWAGSRSGEDLAAYYASADLFLFPSQSETYGNVVVEAMASGLPPVSFDLAVASSLIESNRNGYLAAPGDSLSFRDALRRALGSQSRWSEMGAAARASVADLSWDKIVTQFEAYLVRAAGTERDDVGRLPSKGAKAA